MLLPSDGLSKNPEQSNFPYNYELLLPVPELPIPRFQLLKNFGSLMFQMSTMILLMSSLKDLLMNSLCIVLMI